MLKLLCVAIDDESEEFVSLGNSRSVAPSLDGSLYSHTTVRSSSTISGKTT